MFMKEPDTDNRESYPFENWAIGNSPLSLSDERNVIIVYYYDAWTANYRMDIDFFFIDIWVEYLL